MSNSTTFNQKAFNSKLTGVITSAKNIKAKIQELLVDALVNQAGATGNLGALTDLLIKTKSVRSINSKQLEKVVFHFAEGIEWNTKKNKKGEKITSLRVKKGKTLAVTAPTMNWADFEKDAEKPEARGFSAISADSLAKKVAVTREKAELSTEEALASRIKLMEAEIVAMKAIAASKALVGEAAPVAVAV